MQPQIHMHETRAIFASSLELRVEWSGVSEFGPTYFSTEWQDGTVYCLFFEHWKVDW